MGVFISHSLGTILNQIENSSVEITLHLKNGHSLKGFLEKKVETADNLPFVLRSKSPSNGTQLHLISEDFVGGITFEEPNLFFQLFSKKRQQRRTVPAPTLLEMKRNLSSFEPLKNISVDIRAAENLTDEHRWLLYDFTEYLYAAWMNICSDSLGRQELSKIKTFSIQHQSNVSVVVDKSTDELTIKLDMLSAGAMSSINSEIIKNLIEAKL